MGGRDVTRRLLSGWGGTAAVVSDVREPITSTEVGAALAEPKRGAIGRGLGRSYGDAAQRAGGVVVSTLGLRSSVTVDAEAATVTAGAGWSLRELIDEIVPMGWFFPVVPGTADVTLGGAIAADVHGKNHHRSGSLGSHVRSLELVTSDGRRHRLEPHGASSPAFWATVGGMGLTGMITGATVAVRAVVGDRLAVTSRRLGDIDGVMAALIEADAAHEYTVAWLDLADPARRGRGIVDAADHLDEASAVRPTGSTRPTVPNVPVNVVRPRVTRAFNEVWWRRAPVRPRTTASSFARFFHPLDAVASWGRLYGPTGFTQWQMAVPVDAVDAVRTCAERLAKGTVPPSLVVLKRFGAADPAPLSFPQPGWTLAVDLPANDPTTAALLDALDDVVVGAGGRIYLAKDARLRPDLLAAMYPRIDEWRAERDRLDPGRAMASDLSLRLGLV
jgi:decaprenylphospho-beta-D-ribofuranose 2-oxidase